ncbi:hypothetical protein SH580_00505 [Coraliomargarita algicola]|uniref:VWFA domain-containing protein n=1 Tax=Coraliomargarita algicola TaxID=3092156 RepID=A0ABZ0RJ04_9BACT|nr:hypothetical protein [Coraliomargarita sp. J2-16]WPJ96180.1 hypothetical protein SH580_00505 [Coraliomargarita sp. J2-16]
MISKPKKRKMNPMLLNVLLISGGVHAVALFILGSITVYKYIIPDEAQFEEPAVVEQVEPPKEVKVEIKQQAAPQNQPLNKLRMKQVGNISVANIDVDLPSMEESFTVSAGLGSLGGGSLLGGTRGSIGIGMSDVSIFGLKTRAERILFAIDASKTMLTDAKGGLNSYRVIKDEISTMVSNLSTGTLFNVVFFNDGKLKFFKPRPVPAGDEVTQELITWIAPINADFNKLGLPGAKSQKLTTFPEDNLIQDQIPRHQWHSGNENAYLAQVFLEQSIDAIFIITGRHTGFQSIRRSPTQRENEEWARHTSKAGYQKALAKYKEERPQAVKKAQEALAKENAERKKKGLPPRILDGGDIVGHMKIRMENRHPGRQPVYHIDGDKIRRYFRELTKVLYDDQGSTPPSINVVLFLAGDEKFSKDKEDALKDYTRFFDGKYRIIRGLNEIKSAASASATTNK